MKPVEPELYEGELRLMAMEDKNPTLALLNHPEPLETTYARMGVWDRKNYRIWSPLKECRLNEWDTIEVSMVGTETGRGRIFIHTEPGFRGHLYIDNVEVIWGGPTETERMVDKVIKKCETNHRSHTDFMRIKIIDARHLSAVDWGGTSDPFCKVQVESSKTPSPDDANLVTTDIGRSSVVYADLDPVWNMDPIQIKKPPPPPKVTKLHQADAALLINDLLPHRELHLDVRGSV